MPQLSGTQSPVLGSIFARRDRRPLYMELATAPPEASADEGEKTPMTARSASVAPQIILTPSTPTHERSHSYSTRSLVTHPHAFFAEYATAAGFQRQPILLLSPTASEAGDSDSEEEDSDEYDFGHGAAVVAHRKKKRSRSCASAVLPRLARYAVFVAIIAIIVLLHVIVLRRIAAQDS